MQYIATINTPGYMPDGGADEAVFDTAAEAWAYLADERDRHIGVIYDGEADPDGNPWGEDRCLDMLGAAGSHEGQRPAGTAPLDPSAFGLAPDWTGTITGPTPGYTGDHDLGKAYTVTARQGVTCVDCGQTYADTDAAQAHWDAVHSESWT